MNSVEAPSTWQHGPPTELPVRGPGAAPFAARRPAVLEKHGDRRLDPYYWLRQRANPEVIAHLIAENEYADFVMEPTRVLQERLYNEIVGRIQQTDYTAPSFFKGYWHYTRTVEGLDYEIQCRRLGSMDAPEEVELDGNVLADGHEYFDLGFVERSPDGTRLASAADFTATDLHKPRSRTLATHDATEDAL